MPKPKHCTFAVYFDLFQPQCSACYVSIVVFVWACCSQSAFLQKNKIFRQVVRLKEYYNFYQWPAHEHGGKDWHGFYASLPTLRFPGVLKVATCGSKRHFNVTHALTSFNLQNIIFPVVNQTDQDKECYYTQGTSILLMTRNPKINSTKRLISTNISWPPYSRVIHKRLQTWTRNTSRLYRSGKRSDRNSMTKSMSLRRRSGTTAAQTLVRHKTTNFHYLYIMC